MSVFSHDKESYKINYCAWSLNISLSRIRYCFTARGGFCYSEEDIFDFHAGKEFFALSFH